MSNYTTLLLEQPYFFTATILNWKHLLKPDKYKQIVVDSLKYLVENKRIAVYGFVIMPNHIHLIWEMLPSKQKELAYASFLKFTAHQFLKDLEMNHSKVLEKFEVNEPNKKHNFWQKHSLPIRVESREVCVQKLDYLHLNPLQSHWNLADRPENYYWSSARFYECEKDDFGFITHYMDRF